MANKLDINQPLVEPDTDTGELKATSYFEDYLYKFVIDLGGEGGSPINNTLDVSVDKTPDLSRIVNNLQSRVSGIEAQLNDQVLASKVKSLLAVTSPFNSKIKETDYTAKNKDWVEMRRSKTCFLPKNASRDHQVMISNGDGSGITVKGNGTNIKYTSTSETFLMRNIGSNYHFQLFIDNGETERYWRVI